MEKIVEDSLFSIDMWKDFINALPEPEDTQIVGTLNKLSLDIFMFHPKDSDKMYLMQSQRYVEYGEQTLEDSKKLVRKTKSKKGS